MSSAAQRMKAMRERRRAQGLREIRLLAPDARSPEVRRRVAEFVAKLDPADEEAAMEWAESVSIFSEPDETR